VKKFSDSNDCRNWGARRRHKSNSKQAGTSEGHKDLNFLGTTIVCGEKETHENVNPLLEHYTNLREGIEAKRVRWKEKYLFFHIRAPWDLLAGC
jgi:hypothetical protein